MNEDLKYTQEDVDKIKYENRSRLVMIVSLFIIAFIVVIFCGYNYFTENISATDAQSYDDGYEVGYDEGYEVGYDEGYSERDDELLNEGEANYIPPDENVNTPPDTAVFVTPSGSKYHTEYCRYVDDRTDISYYNSSEEAEQEGYAPCSVCH